MPRMDSVHALLDMASKLVDHPNLTNIKARVLRELREADAKVGEEDRKAEEERKEAEARKVSDEKEQEVEAKAAEAEKARAEAEAKARQHQEGQALRDPRLPPAGNTGPLPPVMRPPGQFDPDRDDNGNRRV